MTVSQLSHVAAHKILIRLWMRNPPQIGTRVIADDDKHSDGYHSARHDDPDDDGDDDDDSGDGGDDDDDYSNEVNYSDVNDGDDNHYNHEAACPAWDKKKHMGGRIDLVLEIRMYAQCFFATKLNPRS
ncbi:unnamed protein product [Calicophoron daubneyi]|uniref:Uncharacterized protein n=1 Tax=Calicophoron daubneyi TaxID=300641 RepID=A0AAV2TPS6_CALDB